MTHRDDTAIVTVQQWVSLDGFAAGPTGEMEVMRAVDEDADARSQSYNEQVLADVAGVLLGRRTYEQFVEYWPTATEPIARRVNAVPKTVASRSLVAAPWGDLEPAAVVADAADHVERFRDQGSGRLLIWGSLEMTASLLDSDQIDELDLFIAPIWLGAGRPLLTPATPCRLRQLSSEDWGTITHTRYRILR